MGAESTKLTPRQRRFCREYLVDYKGPKAAVRSGYTEKAAHNASVKLLKDHRVKQYIDKLEEPTRRRLNITAARVLEELARIAFADMGTFAKWGPKGVELRACDELLPGDRAAISELNQTVTKEGGSIRFKLHDKVAALEKLGKHLQMFKDNIIIEHHDVALIAALRQLSDKDVDALHDSLQGRLMESEIVALPADTEPEE